MRNKGLRYLLGDDVSPDSRWARLDDPQRFLPIQTILSL